MGTASARTVAINSPRPGKRQAPSWLSASQTANKNIPGATRVRSGKPSGISIGFLSQYSRDCDVAGHADMSEIKAGHVMRTLPVEEFVLHDVIGREAGPHAG